MALAPLYIRHPHGYTFRHRSVVRPDNAPFEGGPGQSIRRVLKNFNFHPASAARRDLPQAGREGQLLDSGRPSG
jgi:hypothetical protein